MSKGETCQASCSSPYGCGHRACQSCRARREQSDYGACCSGDVGNEVGCMRWARYDQGEDANVSEVEADEFEFSDDEKEAAWRREQRAQQPAKRKGQPQHPHEQQAVRSVGPNHGGGRMGGGGRQPFGGGRGRGDPAGGRRPPRGRRGNGGRGGMPRPQQFEQSYNGQVAQAYPPAGDCSILQFPGLIMGSHSAICSCWTLDISGIFLLECDVGAFRVWADWVWTTTAGGLLCYGPWLWASTPLSGSPGSTLRR